MIDNEQLESIVRKVLGEMTGSKSADNGGCTPSCHGLCHGTCEVPKQAVCELLPAQKDSSGKTLERAVEYVADFVYTTAAGEVVVEDVKGVRTREYIIKRKLMLWRHHVQIREV